MDNGSPNFIHIYVTVHVIYRLSVVGSVLVMQSAMLHIMDQIYTFTCGRRYHCFFDCCMIHSQRSEQMLQVFTVL